MPTRKSINRGFYGFETDDAEFLKPDNTDVFATDGFSQHGYNKKFDDVAGDTNYSGAGDDSFKQDWRASGEVASDNAAFLKPSSVGDADYAHTNLGTMVDDLDGMGSGSPILGGGGPLRQDKGIGAGSPRHAPKNTPARAQSNWSKRR
jgi:hypothetical protein